MRIASRERVGNGACALLGVLGGILKHDEGWDCTSV